MTTLSPVQSRRMALYGWLVGQSPGHARRSGQRDQVGARTDPQLTPDPQPVHPLLVQQRVVFLKPLVSSPKITAGEYTDHHEPGDPAGIERIAAGNGLEHAP